MHPFLLSSELQNKSKRKIEADKTKKGSHILYFIATILTRDDIESYLSMVP